MSIRARAYILIPGIPVLAGLLLFAVAGPIEGSHGGYVVISELQVAGATANDEFIELYNPTGSPIDLDVLPLKLHIRNSSGTDQNRALTFVNKTIVPHGYFLIGPSSGYTGTTPLDATYSASGNMLVANGGIYLSKNTTADTDVIDKLGWGSQPSPGFEPTAFAQNPDAGKSIERKPGGSDGNGQDLNDNSQDFILQSSPNPQNSSSATLPPIVDTTPPVTTSVSASAITSASATITWTTDEPSTSQVEYGLTESYGSLTPEDTTLVTAHSVTLSSLSPNTLYHYRIKSKDAAGNTISSGDNQFTTLANSNTNSNTNTTPPSYSSKITLNELFPNPSGDEIQGEFIELANLDTVPVDLRDWKITDAAGSTYLASPADFPSTLLGPGAYLVIPRSISKIPLNNTGGESVHLFSPDDVERASTAYSQTAPEDSSYARRDDGLWFWTTTVTKGAANVFTTTNRAPTASFSTDGSFTVGEELKFDASDSSDPDGDALTFSWDFGDGAKSEGREVRHAFAKEGAVTMTLSVSDGKETVTREQRITLIAPPTPEGTTGTQGSFAVILSEFLPNPLGSDDGEWVELANRSEREVGLGGWRVDDGEGGSGAYTIPSGTTIAPLGFFYIPKSKSSIVLNNSGDTVRLFNDAGSLVSQVSYTEPPEGSSFALGNDGTWRWTTTPTPGKANSITEEPSEDAVVSAGGQAKAVALKELPNIPFGTRVKVEGVVSVEPGILGKNILYLQGSGVQIFVSSDTTLPSLARGDRVSVVGELRRVLEGLRIGVARSEDILLLGPGTVADPEVVQAGTLSDELLANLVVAEGDVVEEGDGEFTLADGSGEIRVVLKEGREAILASLVLGDRVSVVGIVSKTKKGYRLLPRDEDDVVQQRVLGEATRERGQSLPTKTTSGQGGTSWILLASGIGVGVVLFAVGVWGYLRWRRAKEENILNLNE